MELHLPVRNNFLIRLLRGVEFFFISLSADISSKLQCIMNQNIEVCRYCAKSYQSLIQHYSQSAYWYAGFIWQEKTKGYVQLLQFLDKHNAPKYAFDELLEILHLMSIQNFDFQTVNPRRKKLWATSGNNLYLRNANERRWSGGFTPMYSRHSLRLLI
jgi:hypothetical protein